VLHAQNPAGGNGKKGVFVNTPTLTWAYTKTKEIKREGKNSIGIGSCTQKRDTIYLNKK
jgi:hypothetical protein